MIPLSILELAQIPEGKDAKFALDQSVRLAQFAEAAGYTRMWFAEHHNMVGIASAATSVVIGHVASHTNTLRLGSGGIMLPNHSPIVIAEQFGTLATLYGDRIDLGLGRAPGTDPLTMRALRRNQAANEAFPHDVLELIHLLGPLKENQQVRAVPGYGTEVPVWILGSSLFGAQLAAAYGLPYSFAAHFAPHALAEASHLYRSNFAPHAEGDTPYFMPCIPVIVAETDEEAEYLFTTTLQIFTNMARNARGKMPPPIDDMDAYWAPHEAAQVTGMMRYAIVGSKETVKQRYDEFVEKFTPDEVMVATTVFDADKRLRSFELLAEALL